MKVKLNKDIYSQVKKLNEVGPAPNDSESKKDLTGDNAQRFQDAYEYQCKQQYINSKKQDALMVDIKMPSDMAKPLKIDKAPEDLGNLMRSLETNGKFMNVHNMVEDPQKTFNHASDFALNCFGNLGKVEVAQKEYQKNTENTFKESYLYKGIYDQLNEGITDYNPVNQTALAVGAKAGMGAGNIINGGLQAVSAACGGIIAQTAMTASILYGIGYFGEDLMGHADDTGSQTNNWMYKDGKPSGNIETADNSNSNSDMNWKGDNAMEAIDEYIKDLKESVGNLIAQVSSKPSEYTKFTDEIDKYLHAEDEQLKTFFKLTDDVVNKARKQEEEDYLRHKEVEDRNNKERADFNMELIKLQASSDLSKSDMEKCGNIARNYEEYCRGGGGNFKIRLAYSDAVKTGDIKQVFAVFDEYGGKASNKFRSQPESMVYDNDSNALNEAVDAIKKPEANVTEVYHNINGALSKLMSSLFPLGDSMSIPGLKTLDEKMTNQITEATKLINERIDTVCATINKGQDQKLGDRIKSFFMSHPLQSNALKKLWLSHESELKMRKARRIKQMSDYGNNERIVGWSVKFCKNVVPTLFARLFAYRYLLAVLKREGYYNYTPERFKEDEAEWENVKGSELLKKTVVTEWILSHYGSDYTVDNKPYITYDKQGITPLNNMNYASLMLMKVKDPKNPYDITKPTDIQAAHQIAGNNTADKIRDLIESISMVFNPDSSKIMESIEKFRISDEFAKTREPIKNAYNQIVNLKDNLNTDNLNMTQAWNLLVNKPELFKKYKENYKKVDELTSKYAALIKTVSSSNGNLTDDDNKQMKAAEREIKDILGDFVYDQPTTFELDFKNMLTPPDNDNKRVDYYAFVASFYYGLLNNSANKIAIGNVSAADANTPNGIIEICNDTVKALNLITSGIFTIGGIRPMSKNDMELYALQKTMHKYTEEQENTPRMTTLKEVYAYAGGSIDEFDNAYNMIDEALKADPEKGKNQEQKYSDIYNEVIHLFETPTDASDTNINDKVKNNMANLFKAQPSGFTAFDTLKMEDNIMDGKDVTSFLKFAKMDINCEFKEKDVTKQEQFLNDLKSNIRHIIEYVLSSQYSNDATRSVEFNIIVKDLHNIIANTEHPTELYPFIKNAFVNSGGDGNSLDTEFTKISGDIEDVSKFGNALTKLLQNPTPVLEAKFPNGISIKGITAINITVNDLNFKGNLKDCTLSTIYELAQKDSNIEDIKYTVNEEDDDAANTFMDRFKMMIKYIIAGCLQLTYDKLVAVDPSKIVNTIASNANNYKADGNDLLPLQTVYTTCGGKTDDFLKATNKLDDAVKIEILNNFTTALEYPDNNVLKYTIPAGKTPAIPLTTLTGFTGNDSIDFKKFIKDANFTTLNEFVTNAKDDKKYEVNKDIDGVDTDFIDKLKEAFKYIIEYAIDIAVFENDDPASALVNKVVNEMRGEKPNVKVLYDFCTDNANPDAYINAIKGIDPDKLSEDFKNIMTADNINKACAADKTDSFDTPVSDAIKDKGNYSIDFRKYIRYCKADNLIGLTNNVEEGKNATYKVDCEDADKDQFVNDFKSLILRLIAYTIDQVNTGGATDDASKQINEIAKALRDAEKFDGIRAAYIAVDGDVNTYEKVINKATPEQQDGILKNLNAALFNPTDAIDYNTPDGKEEIITLNKPDWFKGNGDINYAKYLKDNKCTSFIEFKTGENYVATKEADIQTEFIDKLKAAIKYLIQYSICMGMAGKEPDTDSDTLNIIVKNLKDANYKGAYLACDGTGKTYEDAIAKGNTDMLKAKINEIFENTTVAILTTNNKGDDGIDVTEVTSDDIKKDGISGLKLTEYIKDNKFNDLAGLLNNYKDDAQYVVDKEKQDVDKFMTYFKEVIKHIIEYALNDVASSTNIGDFVNKINEKVIYNLSISEYANSVFSTMRTLNNFAHKTNAKEAENYKNLIIFANFILEKMNKLYCTTYNEIDSENQFDVENLSKIDLNVFSKENTPLTGVFKILDGFTHIPKDSINNIDDIFNALNGVAFGTVTFGSLDKTKKKSILLNMIQAFKQIDNDNMPNAFRSFYEIQFRNKK